MKKAFNTKAQVKQTLKSNEAWNMVSYTYQYRYLLVITLSFLLYSNTIFNDYNLDDTLVTQNHVVTSQGMSLDNIARIFTQPYYQDNMGYSYGYRPLTTLSFAVEHTLWGDNPHLSHFINLILYSLLCSLLLLTLERMLKGYNICLPLAATAIFVCHPMHTEVVASIKNRDEIFSFLGGLLVLYTMLSERKTFTVKLLFSLLFFWAGTLSKPNLVLLPELVVLALLLFRKEKSINLAIISFTLSIVSIFYMENISDGFKFLYVFGDLVFCFSMIGYVNGWYNWSKIKANIEFDFFKKNLDEKYESNFLLLKGHLYILFLAANITIGVLAFYATLAYSSPWIVIVLGLIYAIELYFFQLHQLWLTIVFLDLACLFLISSQLSSPLAVSIKQTFFIYFSFFLLSILVNIKDRFFLLAFAVAYLLLELYIYLHPDTSTVFGFAILFPSLTYIYRKKLYTSKFFLIPAFIVVSVHGVNFAFYLFTFGSRSYMFFDMAFFTLYLVGFLASLFNISTKRLPVLFAFMQILLVAGLFLFSQSFSLNTMGWYANGSGKMEETIRTAQSAKQLPSITKSTGLNRPIHFIEYPIKYPTSSSTLIATSAYQFSKYVLLLLKPWPMSFYYGYKEVNSHSFHEPVVILSAFVFLALLFFALFLSTKRRDLSFGLFFMLMSLLPYLSVVSVIPGMIAERYTFQSSLGFCILIAVLLTYFGVLPSKSPFAKYLDPKKYRQIAVIVFVALIAGYTLVSFIRNSQWKDSVTLMRHDIKVVPQSIQAHNLLAHHLIEKSFAVASADEQKQLRQEGLIHFRSSVELYPGFLNSTYDLARDYALLNEADSAIYWFKKSIAIDSTFTNAYLSLGEILFQISRYDEAIPYWTKVIQRFPNDYTAYDRLGLIYMKQVKYDKAMDIYIEAIKRNPANIGSYLNIGIIYSNTNRIDSARHWYQKGLEINPGNKDAIQLLQGLDRLGHK